MVSKIRIKKGQSGLEDIFFVLAFLFAAAILIFIIYHVFSQVKDPIDSALSSAIPGGETSFNITTMNNQTLGSLGLFNGLFPFLLIGLIIMTMVSAFFINSHPVFFFISIIILGVVILLGIVYSNIYQQITQSPEFGDTEDKFTVINFFMKYLPFIIALIMIIVMIILFGRPGGGTGGL